MTEIVAQLSALSGLGAQLLWGLLLVFLRVGAAMALIPAFGEQSVPQRVRLVLALAFTAVIAPAVVEEVSPVDRASPGAMLIEVAVGLLLGAGLRLFILALQILGAIAAQATSLSQLFAATGPEPQPAIGHLLVVSGLALAVALDLHVRVAEALIGSYAIFPPGGLPASADVAEWGVAQVAGAFTLGFSLAAPFVIAAVLYNVALGVINRALPQLMVSFVGAPALSAGGLVLMAMVAPLALAFWAMALKRFLDAPFATPP